MKKNTLAKWVLAGAAMVVAFACQSKKSPDDSGRGSSNDNSSCPCTGGHSTLVVPPVEIKVEEVATMDQASDEAEVSTYVIEIMDSTEGQVDSAKNETTATKTLDESPTTLNTAPSNLDEAADATDSTIYVNKAPTATNP